MFGLSALATKLILGGILAAVLSGGIWYGVRLIQQNGALSSQLDQSVATNKANLAAFKEAKDDMQAAADSVRQQHAVEIARLAKDSKLKQQIASSPASDNGKVAPVLARTLEALRSVNAP